MKGLTKTLLTLLIVICCPALVAVAQPAAAADGVSRAIREGNASEIVRFSGNTIDITINNNQATYSRTQGELVLRDFFNRNSVRDFAIEHSGTSSSNNSMFTLGTLTTSTGRYRVYLLMRQRDGGYTLAELRLQK